MNETTESEASIRARMERAWAQRESARERTRAAVEALDPALALDELEVVRGHLDWRAGRHDLALERSGRVIGQRPPDVWVVRALSLRGCALSDLGDYLGASEALERQVQLARELGLRPEEATGVHDLGALHLDRDPERARPYLQRARTLAEASGDPELLAFAVFNLGLLDLHRPDPEAARQAFGEALTLARARGLRLIESAALGQLGGLALADGRRAEAEMLLRAALARSNPLDPLAEEVFTPLGALLLDTGRAEEARELLEGRLQGAETSQARPVQIQLHAALAEVHERRGDPARALGHLKASLALFREVHAEGQDRQVRALEVLHRTQQAERAAAEARAKSEELGAAIEQLAQLHQEAQQLSLTDELTGCWNRRFLITRGSQLAASASPAHPLAMAVVDLDHFKRINDTYGHDHGDSVLREFADLLRRHLPAGAYVVRSGGEEFVALFPGQGPEVAARALELLRAQLRHHRWPGLPPRERLTFTAGVDVCLDGQLLDTLRRADRLLYGGKAGGRDTVRRPAPPG